MARSPETPASTTPASPKKAASGGMRQELLRQLVEDNVALQEGRAPTPPRPAPSLVAAARAEGRRPWVWATILTLLSSLFLIRLVVLPMRAAQSKAAEAAPAAPSTPAPPKIHLEPLFDSKLSPIDPSVLGLKVKRIVVDPGHGGHDTGTTIRSLHEKDLTLDIGLKLRDRLVAQGFEVLMTRESDEFIDLTRRSELANQASGDLFVSIHINWLPRSRESGVETYFVGTTEDPRLLELAQRENAYSGAEVSDYRDLLDRLLNQIATEGRQDSSRAFAARVQQALFNSLRPDNPDLTNRGVKSAPFVVLVGTQMPAILAEVACLSSDKDAAMLGKPLYRDSIADALSRGIRRYADDINPVPSAAPAAPQKGK